MYIDMHSHLRGWSPDADQSAEALLEAAAEKRLDGIAVTDHYEMDTITEGGQRWAFDPAQHEAENARFRLKPSERSAADRPGFLIGVEIGYRPNRIADMRAVVSGYPFDCVILSMHEYKGLDPVLSRENLYAEDACTVYSSVIGLIAESAEAFPEADVIGHYDFFSRYAPYAQPKMRYRHAPEAFDRLFCAMVRNDQALEINTGTVEALHKKRGLSLEEAMPDAEILARYRALGGRLITLGSDAHQSRHVARCFPETAQWLRGQGILEYAWLEERRWHLAPL